MMNNQRNSLPRTSWNPSMTPTTTDKKHKRNFYISLLGNPNVGKSTLFNLLTGLNQHTGNWAGKTVTMVQGHYHYHDHQYVMVDLPGTYSLLAHSPEEEVARDYLCFGKSDAVVVVCDATCLERNLNLTLQILEMKSQVILAVNLIDEAIKKNICIHGLSLEQQLGIPVISISARNGTGIAALKQSIEQICQRAIRPMPLKISYPPILDQAIGLVEPHFITQDPALLPSNWLNRRWCALRLIEKNRTYYQPIKEQFDKPPAVKWDEVEQAVQEAQTIFIQQQISTEQIQDMVISSMVMMAENIAHHSIVSCVNCHTKDRKLDKIFTSRLTGIPTMLFMLLMIFWITIVGANYPSQWLGLMLSELGDKMSGWILSLPVPLWFHDLILLGVYRVVSWVVSVMLPPMAIFFPLFTLLENFGYLPRVAFNLDYFFQKANACGKQALTMCMGFGCNAVGVIGCRIIDSPRERLIGIITNNFVPCNGRFPMLIALISMFFISTTSPLSLLSGIYAALFLMGVILLGVMMTFLVSRCLSTTILKGVPSSFTLELPPYRRPQIKKVLIRSLLDRTLFVLGRAVCVAMPSGLIIWLLANLTIQDITLLSYCSTFLDPFARLLGLDGVILLAFILGFPANEIVLPLMIMGYLSQGTMMEMSELTQLKTLLLDQGWTGLTAVCTLLFCLIHWPCSTTCWSIKKETNSWKWMLIAFLIPTLLGLSVCFMVATVVRLLA